MRLLLVVSTLIGSAGLLASLVWGATFLMRSRSCDGGQVMLVVFAAGALLGVVAVLFGPLVRFGCHGGGSRSQTPAASNSPATPPD